MELDDLGSRLEEDLTWPSILAVQGVFLVIVVPLIPSFPCAQLDLPH